MHDKLKSLRDSVEFAEEKLVASVQSLLQEILDEKGLNKADLAKKMGVSKARVSQIFSDNQNFTLRLLASAFHSLGEEMMLVRCNQKIEFKGIEKDDEEFVRFEEKIQEISHGFEWLDKIPSSRRLIDNRNDSDKIFAKAFSDFSESEILFHKKNDDSKDINTADEWRNAANIIPFKRRA